MGHRHWYQKLTGSCLAMRGQSVLKKEGSKCQGNNQQRNLTGKEGALAKWADMCSFFTRGLGPWWDETGPERSQSRWGSFKRANGRLHVALGQVPRRGERQKQGHLLRLPGSVDPPGPRMPPTDRSHQFADLTKVGLTTWFLPQPPSR